MDIAGEGEGLLLYYHYKLMSTVKQYISWHCLEAVTESIGCPADF